MSAAASVAVYQDLQWMERTRPRWDVTFDPQAANLWGRLRLCLSDKLWRLNNLYPFVDAHGAQRIFEMKPAMFDALMEEHWRNVMLKARQYGWTTLFVLDELDDAIFTPRCNAQLTAHNLDDATKIFAEKVIYAWDHLGQLPDGQDVRKGLSRETWAALALSLKVTLKETKRTSSTSGAELAFSNDSRVRVTTSGRSGTLQHLHISELGKVAATAPSKATEIMTGSVPATKGGKTWVESTAEGNSGAFFDLCKQAEQLAAERRPLTRGDWRFFFFPWWIDTDYQLTDEEASFVVEPPRLTAYFTGLTRQHGIQLTRRQRAWYVVEERTQGTSMKREYPSTPKEAFEAAAEGRFWANEMGDLRRRQPTSGITRVPVVDGVPIDTWWDLGMHGYTSIWLEQTIGREVRFIDFIEDRGHGLAYYAQELRDRAERFGWVYGVHHAPHDIGVTELGSGVTRLAQAAEFGLHFVAEERTASKEDDIEAARRFLSYSWFDETRTAEGVAHLDKYSREWDQVRGVWKSSERSDEHCHAADAYMLAARNHVFSKRTRQSGPAPVIQQASMRGYT